MNRKEEDKDELRTGEIREYSADKPKDEGDEAFLRTGKKEEGTPVYLTDNSTLQSPEEDQHDRSVDPRADDSMSVSEDDLH